MQTSAPRPPVSDLTRSATEPAVGSSTRSAPSRSAMLAAALHRVDPDDRGARGARGLQHDLPRHAEPEHHDEVAEADAGVVHAVQRDRADVRKDADARVGAFRHELCLRLVLAHHMDAAMVPGAEHELARPHPGDAASDRLDPADFLVAEVAHRKGPARIAVAKDPMVGVPASGHERARAAILRQLGAGADPGKERADQHLAGPRAPRRQRLERQASHRFEHQRPIHRHPRSEVMRHHAIVGSMAQHVC